jgi:hypothetical protein
MTPENNGVPEWAQRERQADLAWIAENLDVFSAIASVAFDDAGRDAIVVDATSLAMPGAGYPFGYFSQEQIEELGDEDTVEAQRPRQHLPGRRHCARVSRGTTK